MNTREMAAGYRLTQWAQVMKERTDSGLSIRAFCEKNAIHENTYYYWQRKLRESVYDEIPYNRLTQIQNEATPNGWARLLPARASEVSTESGINIEISGCLVRVNAEVDLNLLKKVCRALQSL